MRCGDAALPAACSRQTARRPSRETTFASTGRGAGRRRRSTGFPRRFHIERKPPHRNWPAKWRLQRRCGGGRERPRRVRSPPKQAQSRYKAAFVCRNGSSRCSPIGIQGLNYGQRLQAGTVATTPPSPCRPLPSASPETSRCGTSCSRKERAGSFPTRRQPTGRRAGLGVRRLPVESRAGAVQPSGASKGQSQRAGIALRSP